MVVARRGNNHARIARRWRLVLASCVFLQSLWTPARDWVGIWQRRVQIGGAGTDGEDWFCPPPDTKSRAGETAGAGHGISEYTTPHHRWPFTQISRPVPSRPVPSRPGDRSPGGSAFPHTHCTGRRSASATAADGHCQSRHARVTLQTVT